MNSFKHLTQEERNIIEQRLIGRESFKSISREPGKDPTTIAKEVKNHIQFRKTGCYGRMFNDCKYRIDCSVKHLYGSLRCTIIVALASLACVHHYVMSINRRFALSFRSRSTFAMVVKTNSLVH